MHTTFCTDFHNIFRVAIPGLSAVCSCPIHLPCLGYNRSCASEVAWNREMTKTVNGFKTKRERAKKMGLFLDWCLLDLEAVAEFRSGHPASIFAPASSLVEKSTAYVSAGAVSCRQHRILLAVLWNYENMQLTWRTSYPLEDIASIYSDPNPSYWVWRDDVTDDGTCDNGTVWERWFTTGQSTVQRPVVCLVVYDGTDEGTVLEMENQQNSNRDKLKQIMYLTVYIPHAQC